MSECPECGAPAVTMYWKDGPLGEWECEGGPGCDYAAKLRQERDKWKEEANHLRDLLDVAHGKFTTYDSIDEMFDALEAGDESPS